MACECIVCLLAQFNLVLECQKLGNITYSGVMMFYLKCYPSDLQLMGFVSFAV